MKPIGVISTIALFMLLGVIAPTNAQQEQQEKQEQRTKPQKQDKPRKQEKVEKHQNKEQQRAQQQEKQEQRVKPQKQDKPGKQEKAEKHQDKQQHALLQERQEERAKPEKPDRPNKHDKPEKQQGREQQGAPPPVQQGRVEQQQRTQQEARIWQDRQGWRHHSAWQQHSTWQEHRARRWQSDHRAWAQRGGYGGYYIPEDRFRLSFGSQHLFLIQSCPAIFMGYPRFRYGDFWFMLVDPWPEDWAETWYATDVVYVDYFHDGYYLCNPRHPSIRIAVFVMV